MLPSSQDAVSCPVVFRSHMFFCFVFHSPLSFLCGADPTSLFPSQSQGKAPQCSGNRQHFDFDSLRQSDWPAQRCVSSPTVRTKPCLKMPRTFVRCSLNTDIWSYGSFVIDPLPNPAGWVILFFFFLYFFPFLSLSLFSFTPVFLTLLSKYEQRFCRA